MIGGEGECGVISEGVGPCDGRWLHTSVFCLCVCVCVCFTILKS